MGLTEGDPFTMDLQLCDDDGIVRRGAMHKGTDYPCTGHAHFAGEHIRCISEAHPDGLPTDLLDALRNAPLGSLPQDATLGPAPMTVERQAWRMWVEGR